MLNSHRLDLAAAETEKAISNTLVLWILNTLCTYWFHCLLFDDFLSLIPRVNSHPYLFRYTPTAVLKSWTVCSSNSAGGVLACPAGTWPSCWGDCVPESIPFPHFVRLDSVRNQIHQETEASPFQISVRVLLSVMHFSRM